MRPSRRRDVTANVLGGVWVFAVEAAVVAAVILTSIGVAALLLWLF